MNKYYFFFLINFFTINAFSIKPNLEKITYQKVTKQVKSFLRDNNSMLAERIYR